MVVSNHQNALMDPLLCCLTAPKQMHFLTRADVFKTPLSRKCVLELNMMPVYRTHDKVDDMTGLNKQTFDVAIERLYNGAAIGIYPEGNHGNKKMLRPFKKGLARLLESAGMKHEKLKTIELVAVGIDYSNYNNSRSDMTVVFSEPFRVDDLLFSDLDAPIRYRQTMDRIRQKLSEVMIDHCAQHYHSLRLAEALLDQDRPWKERKQVLDAIRDSDEMDEEREQRIKQIDDLLAKSNLDPLDLVAFWRGNKPGLAATILSLIISLPALLIFTLPWKLILWLTQKVVRDPHFYSTFKLVFSWILFPIWSLIIAFVLSQLINLHFLYWLGLVVVSGLVALPFLDILSARMKYNRASTFSKLRTTEYLNWKQDAEKISHIIQSQ